MGAPQERELERRRRRFRPARLSLVGLVPLLLVAGAAVGGEISSVRVCADPANLPFSGKDPATPGFEVELARELAREVTFHWIPTYRWPVVRRQLLDGRCDVFFGLPVDPRFTDDNPRLALSLPYYVMGQVLVSRAGEGIRRLEDLKGKVIGVEPASPGDFLVFRGGHHRRIFLTSEETFEALRTRTVDAAVMWSSPAGWLVKRTPGFELTWIRDPEGEFQIAIGMRKSDRELRAAVDRVVTRLIDSKKVEEILRRYGVPLLEKGLGAAGAESSPAGR